MATKKSKKASGGTPVQIRTVSKKSTLRQYHDRFFTWLDGFFPPLADLIARAYMAMVFLKSGSLKFDSVVNNTWQNTVNLYTVVHPVPFLTPQLAAAIGTVGEVLFPIMLLFGYGTRVAALGLLVMTVVIDTTFMSLPLHHLWAIVLALIVARGPGYISLDHGFKYSCRM